MDTRSPVNGGLALRVARRAPNRFEAAGLLTSQAILFGSQTIFTVLLTRSVEVNEFSVFAIWLTTFGLCFVALDPWISMALITGAIAESGGRTLVLIALLRGSAVGIICFCLYEAWNRGTSLETVGVLSLAAGVGMSVADVARSHAIRSGKSSAVSMVECLAGVSGLIPFLMAERIGTSSTSFIALFSWYACVRAILLSFLGVIRKPSPEGLKEVWFQLRPTQSRNYSYALVAFGSRNVDNYLVAYSLGSEALGIYARSFSLVLAPLMQVAIALSPLAMRDLSTEGGIALSVTVWGWTKRLWVIALVLVGPGVIAVHQLVPLVLGEQWAVSVPIMTFLLLTGGLLLVQLPSAWMLQVQREAAPPIVMGFLYFIPLLAFMPGLIDSLQASVVVYVALCFIVTGTIVTISWRFHRGNLVLLFSAVLSVPVLWMSFLIIFT